MTAMYSLEIAQGENGAAQLPGGRCIERLMHCDEAAWRGFS
jgi:hypothetical protein